jgi:hypothetical protein
LVWGQQVSTARTVERPQQALPSRAPKKLDVVEQLARADAPKQKQRALVVAPAASRQKQQAFVLEPKEQADAPAVWLQSDSAQQEFLRAQLAEQPRASK